MTISFLAFVKLIHYGISAYYALGIFMLFWSRFVEDKAEWEEAYEQGNPHSEYIGSNIGACVLLHNIALGFYLEAVPIVFMVFSGFAAVCITMCFNMGPIVEAIERRKEEEQALAAAQNTETLEAAAQSEVAQEPEPPLSDNPASVFDSPRRH